MLTFHNDPAIKEKYLARIHAHAAADEIIKGQYWQNGKGCAVGCTVHSSNHKAYEEELGIPELLARLEDQIFESLPNDKAKEWPEKFLSAINVGVDLEPIKWKFSSFLLKENIDRVLSLKEISDDLKKQVVDSIRGVLSVHEEAIKTGEWNDSAARSAASAESAAWSAAYERYADELLRLLKEVK